MSAIRLNLVHKPESILETRTFLNLKDDISAALTESGKLLTF